MRRQLRLRPALWERDPPPLTCLSSCRRPPSHSCWILTFKLHAVWGGKKLSQGLLGLQDSCGQKWERRWDGWDLGRGAWRMGVGWDLSPLEVRSTLRREGGMIHPRGASVPGREGLVPALSHSHSDRNPLPPRQPRRPSFPQVGSSCALTEVGERLKESAVRSQCRARSGLGGPAPLPFRASGRCAHRPAGGGGEALWVAQCGSPRSAGRQRRCVPGARPSRREQARRGGSAAPGPGGGAYIPGPSRRKPRRFLAGAGTAAATWGAGATPGAGGLEGE